MGQYPADRLAADRRVTIVTGAIHRALVTCIEADPALTEEELLAALLDVAARKTQRLHRGQATASIAGIPRKVPDEWVTAFDQAVAAVGCGVCGSVSACRCLVPAEKRPNKTAIGLAAALPLITVDLEGRADAHR